MNKKVIMFAEDGTVFLYKGDAIPTEERALGDR